MTELGIEDELVAAREIGAFAYHYPGPILDLDGLVSPQVTGTSYYNALYSARPPWIMAYVDMLPEEVRDSSWFRREYRPLYALGTWEGRRATLFRRYPPADETVPFSPRGALGDSMELLAVGVEAKPMGAKNETLHVTLTWKALREMNQHYTVFVHLRDATNKLTGQHDGEPQGNEYPTIRWQVGELVVDKHDLVVDSSALDGQPLLVVGAYETGVSERLLHWSSPTVPQWPHELRITLRSLGVDR